MAIPIEMPKLSDTMEEGVVVAWLAEEGQKVSAGDIIAQVETDKATMDLEIYDDGFLLKRVVGEGDSVSIGGLIAVLGDEGEDISSLLAEYSTGNNGSARDSGHTSSDDQADNKSSKAGAAGAPAATPAETVEEISALVQSGGEAKILPPSSSGRNISEKSTSEKSMSGRSMSERSMSEKSMSEKSMSGSRVKASPLARRLASERGIDMESVRGSGPEGRIVKRDIESYVPAPMKTEPVFAPKRGRPDLPAGSDSYTSLPLSQMRKAIARRLAESKFKSPHFYLTADFDMRKAVAARIQLNELAARREQQKVSFNDLVTKSCALALRDNKWVNASYLEEEGEIRFHDNIDVAIAVAIDEGLITPIIRNADAKSLGQIAAETRELAARARKKELQPEEYSGSTFTTSNLGMFGIDEFTAIINPPNACILAIGAVRDTPVVENGQVVAGKRMKVTLSCDHRVVDGAAGARFLASVRQYLEDPLSMLL